MMSTSISRLSTTSDILVFLKENHLEEAMEEFEKNEVDGEDFFELELNELYQMIPRLKLRKAFIKVWSEVTKMTFDHNGIKVSRQETSKETPPPLAPVAESGSTAMTPQSSTSEEATPNCTPPSRASHSQSNSSSSSTPAPKKRKLSAEYSPQSQSSNHWLKKFVLPSRWEPDVEEGLKKQSLNPSQKNAMVRQLCSSIMAEAETVSSSDRNHIAILLVQKYPFLKGSFGTGCQMWAKKIEERILNVKRKASRNERKKLQEKGVEVPKAKPGRKKKECNKVSEIPSVQPEETLASLEEQRQELLKLLEKKPSDVHRVRELMDITYPLRRRAVLKEDARVWKVVKDYPCFQDSKANELKAELARILKPDMPREMRAKWEEKKPQILQALKNLKKREIQNNIMLLDDCDASEEKEMENRCIFASLPHILGEKQSSKHSVGKLFWNIIPNDSDTDTSQVIASCTTPRLLSTGSIEDLQSLSLIGEGMVIISFKPLNILNAVIALISSFYSFNCEYPKGQPKNVFAFLEHIMLGAKEPLPMGVENFLSSL